MKRTNLVNGRLISVFSYIAIGTTVMSLLAITTTTGLSAEAHFEGPTYVHVEPVKQEVPISKREVMDIPTITLNSVEETVEMYEITQDEIMTITSKEFINNRGRVVTTSEVEVNITDLPLDSTTVYPEWDYKKRINDVEILWEFLVCQQNVNQNIAAGIIGCIYHEGTFGQYQGSNNCITSINEARKVLSGKATSKGYGIAQWTFSERRELLLKYYEEAYAIYPDDFYTANILAECCCLLEEIKGYNIYESLTDEISIEDATGRMAKLYEAYSGSEDDWSKVNGKYVLVLSDKSGVKRLQSAYDIYDYFMSE